MTMKVLLVDDQNLVRLGICSLLELSDNIDVIGQLSDGCEVINTIKTCTPDVILLDIRMPKTSGISVLQQMKQQNITVPVIVLTTFDERELVLQCMQLGAQGYLRKDVSLDSLLTAISEVTMGNTWIQPAITVEVQQHKMLSSTSSPDDHLTQLTAKEIQILRLVAAGYSNNEIASALFKSDGTIRNAISVILSKLQVRDRTRAVLTAMERKLI